jgi:hypothetical protein
LDGLPNRQSKRRSAAASSHLTVNGLKECGMAFLQIMSGSLKGRRFEVNQTQVLIGRSRECTLSLDDGAVSGKHCVVVREGMRYTLRDLDSTNGTRVNGALVDERPLQPKDIVMVGSVEILFDGTDVEVDPSIRDSAPVLQTAPTIVTSSRLTGGGVSTAFGQRRDTRGIWVLVALVIAAALGALGYWFVSGLFKS